MSDLNVEIISHQSLKDFINCEKFSGFYVGKIKEKNVLLLKHSITLMLVFKDPGLCHIEFTKVVSSNENVSGEVTIVGTENEILLLDSKGNLSQLACNGLNLPFKICEDYTYKWIPYKSIHKGCEFQNFKVLAITVLEEHFVCAGMKSEKGLKFYKFKPLGPREIWTSENVTFTNFDLNFLKGEEISLSLTLDGIPFLISISNGKMFATKLSVEVLSTFQIKSQNCLLICYKSGKISAHSFSDCQIHSVYLGKKITCIEKCFCSDSCLLWSDGVNFHHTGLAFCEGKIKIIHFEVKCNITGILAFAKFSNHIVAVSINNVYYHISQDFSIRKKQLSQRPSLVLSQIYSESLKLNDYQRKLETAAEFLNCKEVILSDDIKMGLKWEGNFLTLKNNERITFKKKNWKISMKMSIESCEHVRVVDLEADLITGMVVKVPNPFDNIGRVKVYLVGDYTWETLYFYVGMVGEKLDSRKENLKKTFHEINLQKNPYLIKK